MDCEPPDALLPDHAPEAVHAVAFVVLHCSVELLPLATVLGLALRLTLGAGVVTTTCADWEADPPGPEQVRV